MLLKSLTLENFLTQYETQRVEFPTAQGSISIVLGPNNSGKSSLVKALQFLLHSRFPNCTEETAWELINNRHREETTNNEHAVAKVSATFISGGTELTIRRTIRSRRVGPTPESFAEPEIALSRLQQTGTGNSFIIDSDGATQRKVELLCPERLLEAFFFSGEPLDGQLLKGVQHVREALEEYLSIGRWEQAADATRGLRQYYASEKQKLAQQNRALEALMLQEMSLQTDIDAKRRSRADAERRFTENKASAEERQTAILQLGIQTRLREDVKKRDELEKQVQREKNEAAAADTEVASGVGSSAGFPFLLPFAAQAEAILSNLYQEGILPADLTADLVARVLKRRDCFCGTVHTGSTRASWNEHLTKALRADVGPSLMKLRAKLNPQGPASLSRVCGEISETIRVAIAEREAAVRNVHSMTPEIEKLSQRIAESPEAELRRLEMERRDFAKRATEDEERGKELEVELKRLEAARRRNKDERDKTKISPDVQRRVTELERYQATADELAELIDQSVVALRAQFQSSLQQSMSRLYDGAVLDATAAMVNANTLLPAIMQEGRRITNLGGGQSQLLGLAYIASIARLRLVLHDGMKRLGIRLGNVCEQTFVLDCPFSGMEAHYIAAAIAGLRSVASQIIFLFHGSQWPQARPYLEGYLGAAWGIHFHAPEAKIRNLKDHDCVYALGQKTFRLASATPADVSRTFSTIEKLPIGTA